MPFSKSIFKQHFEEVCSFILTDECENAKSLLKGFQVYYLVKASIPSPFFLTQSARKLCGKPFVFFWIGFLILLNIKTGLLPARGKPFAYSTLAKTSAIPKSTWK